MEQIGTWTTSTGSVSAILEFDQDADAARDEMPAWVTGALQGAVAGAATGAAAGPYGALIGAAAGGTIGAVTASASQPKPAAPAQPKPVAPAPAAPAPAAAAPSSAQPSSSSSSDTTPAASSQPAAQTNVAQALQQFAALMPALMQLVAASGKDAKELDASDGTAESTDEAEWGPESFEGSWTVP